MLSDTVARWFDERTSLEELLARADRSEAGLERTLWREVAGLGWLGLGVAEDRGGAGVGLVDRLVLFERSGRALTMPELTVALAQVGPCVGEDAALTSRFVSGESFVAVALDEPADRPGVEAEPAAQGWQLTGVKTRVVSAANADEFLVAAREADGSTSLFLAHTDASVEVRPLASPDATRPWAIVAFDATPAARIADSSRTVVLLARLRDETAVACAAEAVGVAQAVLADAAAYASSRHQFGRPVGAFQGVAAPLADAYVEIELARALVHWAAIALDQGGDGDVAAAAALAAASATAVRTAEKAIQVAGAIGFTWEHRAHRYLRRALWIEQFGPSPAALHERVAAALLDEGRPVATAELFDDAPTAEFRAEVRHWIEASLPTTRRGVDLVGDLATYEVVKEEWRRRLVDHGGLVAHWPTGLGGRDATALETAIFREEAIRAHPRVSHGDGGSDLVAPLLMEYGTPDQRDRYLEGIRLETEFWAQGFSEPDAGSDLASLATRAAPVPGGWVLNGQKTWSTYSPVARHLFVLARTDPEAQRHRGITCFIVPADAPGVEVRPIRDIAGTLEFGEVFLTDVAVGDGDVLGPVGQGWSVAVMTLAIERAIESSEDIGELGFVLDRLIDCVRDESLAGPTARDAGVRRRLAALWARLHAVRLVQYRCLVELARSPVPPPESEIVKLAWSELAQRVNRLAVELFGGRGSDSRRAGEVARFWEFWYMMSRSVTIYAGTSEILRSVIAERILRLPRSR